MSSVMRVGSCLTSATSSTSRARLHRPAQLGEAQRQQVHRRDLADERLRRGDGDLHPGARVEHAVGVARGLRADDVRARQHPRAALARQAHRRQRVGGLAGLRDADDELALGDDRVAVAPLRRDVHLDRDARPLLDRVAADQAGVKRRARGEDEDPVDALQQRLVELGLGEVDAVGTRRAVGDRLGDGVGLLVDLLEHERLVAALLGGRLVPVHARDLALDRRAVGRQELDAAGRQHDDLLVLDVLHVARVGEKGGDRGAEELLAVAAADDQRALLARADERAGLVGAHADEGVVALELGVGGAHGLDEAAARHVMRDEVGDDLGVGLRGEVGAHVAEAPLEEEVVLDDPVDDDVDAVARVEVRVGVGLRDAPVRRPARMADPARRRQLGDRDRGAAAASSPAAPRRCASAAPPRAAC